MPEKSDIVTDVCKRCVIGGISVFKRDERVAQVVRERNGGGCDRPRLFSVIAIWALLLLLLERRGEIADAAGKNPHNFFLGASERRARRRILVQQDRHSPSTTVPGTQR